MLRPLTVCCLLAATALAKPQPLKFDPWELSGDFFGSSDISDVLFELDVNGEPPMPVAFTDSTNQSLSFIEFTDSTNQPLPVAFTDSTDVGKRFGCTLSTFSPCTDQPLPVAVTDIDRDGTDIAARNITLLPNNYHWISHCSYGYSNYPRNRTNFLRLRGADNQFISIRCDEFWLPRKDDYCNYGYLSINGLKFCGNRTITTMTARSLELKFVSRRRSARGFKCRIVVPAASSRCQCGVRPRVAADLWRQTSRIVGGTDVTPGTIPWYAYIPQYHYIWECGGAVINNRYVLTAAHCTTDRSSGQLDVILGVTYQDRMYILGSDYYQYFYAEQIILHPEYISGYVDWDFALLKLDREITFTDTVQPVCLPTAGQYFDDVSATVSGFGETSRETSENITLQHVQVPLWNHTAHDDYLRKCLSVFQVISGENYGNIMNYMQSRMTGYDAHPDSFHTLTTNMLCTGAYLWDVRVPVCLGEGGGPLVTEEASGRFRLIGVVSWYNSCYWARNGRYPDLYVRVTEALPWITANTADAQYCSASN